MYCRTCGTAVEPGASGCPGCGLVPTRGREHCPHCGKVTPNPDQVVCLSCGGKLSSGGGSGTSDTGDILLRIAGVVMALSGAWNAIMSFIWFFAMIFVCVGAFWIIPGLLAVVEVGLGLMLVGMGKKWRVLGFVPVLGIVVSMLNLNFMGLMMDCIALILGVVGFLQSRPAEE